MKMSFEQVLDEVRENYKQRVEEIHQAAELGKVASRSEMNAFVNASVQARLVSLLNLHINKGLIATGSDLEGFLNRAKESAIRERSTGFIAVLAICDRLLPTVRPDMKWGTSQSVSDSELLS